MYQDPIQKIENTVRKMNDGAGKYTQPVLHRYPLLFAFLTTFSVAAIMHGFKIIVEHVEFFNIHPFVLMSAGILSLAFTGTLYKLMDKNSE